MQYLLGKCWETRNWADRLLHRMAGGSSSMVEQTWWRCREILELHAWMTTAKETREYPLMEGW